MKLTKKQIEFRHWLESILKDYKSNIDDDMKDHADELPSIQITIATNDDAQEFGFQSGDNSFSGACYHYPIWHTDYLFRRSNCKKLASNMINELINKE
jgi:hypothetical protein